MKNTFFELWLLIGQQLICWAVHSCPDCEFKNDMLKAIVANYKKDAQRVQAEW